jgi:hypothetical protein
MLLIDARIPSLPAVVESYQKRDIRHLHIADGMLYASSLSDVDVLSVQTSSASPLSLVMLDGVANAVHSSDTLFKATVYPLNGAWPVDYTWETSEGHSIVHRGQNSSVDTISVKWATPGTKTITVTTTNEAGGYFVARHTCEVREPPSFTTSGTYTVTVANTIQDVAVDGSLAYVAAGKAGLYVVDTGNQSASELGRSYVYTPTFDVIIQGNVAYAGSEEAVLLLDVSQSITPTLLGSYRLSEEYDTYEMTVQGNMLIVAAYTDVDASDDSVSFVLSLIDVSNPATPTRVGRYIQEFNGTGFSEVQVVGNYLYMMKADSLWIMDISNPAEPFLQQLYLPVSEFSTLYVQGSLAYVVDGKTLKVLDLSDLAFIRELGSYPIVSRFGDIQDVEVHGSYVFLQMEEGVLVIDAFDKEYPALAGSFSVPEGLKSAMFQDGLLYLGSADGALQMVQVAGLQPSHRSQVYLPMVAKTLR